MKSVISRMISVMIIICIIGMSLIIILGAVLSGTSLSGESSDKIYNSIFAESLRIDGWANEKVAYILSMAKSINFIEDKSKENLETYFAEQAAADPEIFALYIGFPNGSAVFNDGWIPDDDWISYERPWYQGAEKNKESVYISEIYTDAETEEFVVSISKAVIDENGRFTGVFCADIFVTVVEKIVFDINVAKGSYAFAVNNAGDILIHPNKSYSPVYNAAKDEDEFKNIKEIAGRRFADMWAKNKNGESASIAGEDGIKRQYTSVLIPSLDWRLYIAVPENTINAPIYRLLWVLIPLSLVAVAALIIAGIIISRSIGKILREAAANLQQSATEIISTSNKMIENSNELADSGSRQAASIEQTSAAMNETASMTENNTKNTKQALIVTNETARDTMSGIEKVSSLIKYMDELAKSSREISKVINEISGIASQTNILALNASVESARAGEAGKAFSVVSEEVRTLAQRCNDAAKNTAAIIEKNVELTNNSMKNSREVSEAFEAISEKMGKINQIVAEITTASDEKSKGVDYVNRALSDMEGLTQANVAISQKSLQAAHALSAHSDVLQELTDRIKKLVGQS